mgnify:FL=1|jgi:hypothetical protein|tara:strand:+ start:669 stop:1319 length:651 start_codon:yes stop_codon:yes gene_type:complete
MTYAELKAEIAAFLNRSDLTSELDFFIDQTEAELNRRVRTADMVKRATADCDGQYLTVPTDWLEAINIEITSNNFAPLFQLSLESLDVYRKSINDSSGQPIYYAMVDDTIEVCPTPDTSRTLQLTYYSKVPALSDSQTTNFVSTNHPDIYLYGCLKNASIYLMEDERAAGFQALFDKGLEEIRMADEKAAFAKGSLIPRRRTYGKVKKQTYYWSNN